MGRVVWGLCRAQGEDAAAGVWGRERWQLPAALPPHVPLLGFTRGTPALFSAPSMDQCHGVLVGQHSPEGTGTEPAPRRPPGSGDTTHRGPCVGCWHHLVGFLPGTRSDATTPVSGPWAPGTAAQPTPPQAAPPHPPACPTRCPTRGFLPQPFVPGTWLFHAELGLVEFVP